MLALSYRCTNARFVAAKALGGLWKGAYLSPLAPARLGQVTPPALSEGWAMVRVAQCGLCASDIHLIRLQFSPFIAPAALVGDITAPVILGHELVGRVERTGENCTFSAGARVVSRSGGFRNCANLHLPPCRPCQEGEYALCHNQGQAAPPHEPIRGGGFAELYWEHSANLLPVPDALSDDAAMLVEPLACSLRAVLRLGGLMEEPAGRVLVVGAGVQGLGAVHWLSRLYAQTNLSCLARYAHQAELARQLGARQVVTGRPKGEELARIAQTRCLRGLGGNELLEEGFDAVIDSIGSPATLEQSLRWVRPGGAVVVLGAHLAAGKLDYSPIWFRQVHVTGVYAHGTESYCGRRISTLELTMELLSGPAALPVNLVTHRVALKNFAAALALHDNKALSGAIRIAICP
jgi:threonine dehydrogenase-like Zn-dependent dehydrogenase